MKNLNKAAELTTATTYVAMWFTPQFGMQSEPFNDKHEAFQMLEKKTSRCADASIWVDLMKFEVTCGVVVQTSIWN